MLDIFNLMGEIMANLNKLIPIPAGINPSLNGTRNSQMLAFLGKPGSRLNQNCGNITDNPRLLARMKTASVGPFRVTGFDIAVDSLKEVMDDVKTDQPDVFRALGTAGMLCVRLVRGSRTAISNHSWGTAVDLKLNDVLDRRGNDRVQTGLALIAPVFNRHGWFWGAGFRTEDAMHFEISRQKLQDWKDDGKLIGDGVAVANDVLTLGDRSSEVVELQEALNREGGSLEVDGIFGPDTHSAVVAFQAVNGLTADGVVGKRTRAKLRI